MAALPFVRLVVGGHMDASNQTWSVGTSWGLATMPTNAQLFTWLTGVGAATTTYINATGGPKAMWGNNTVYDTLECYAYDANATTAGAQAAAAVTPIAGLVSPPLPTQLAIVHSLLSGSPGRKNRGRYYMPMTSASLLGTSEGQLTAAACTSLSTTAVAWFHAVSAIDIGTQAPIPVVATRGSEPYVLIESINVDSKVDTQRRRVDKEAALFHTLTAL